MKTDVSLVQFMPLRNGQPLSVLPVCLQPNPREDIAEVFHKKGQGTENALSAVSNMPSTCLPLSCSLNPFIALTH